VVGLACQLAFAFVDRRVELSKALRAVGPLPLQVLQAQAFFGDADLGTLQVFRQAIAVPRALVHALLEIADFLANLLEFLLLDLGKAGPVILGKGGRRYREYQQNQRVQGAHGRTV
jgi:hypothetical protein